MVLEALFIVLCVSPSQVVDLALLVKQDMTPKAGDPFSHAISATFIQYHNSAAEVTGRSQVWRSLRCTVAGSHYSSLDFFICTEAFRALGRRLECVTPTPLIQMSRTRRFSQVL